MIFTVSELKFGPGNRSSSPAPLEDHPPRPTRPPPPRRAAIDNNRITHSRRCPCAHLISGLTFPGPAWVKSRCKVASSSLSPSPSPSITLSLASDHISSETTCKASRGCFVLCFFKHSGGCGKVAASISLSEGRGRCFVHGCEPGD